MACLLQPDVEAESAVNLVQEVYELVADNYLDARSGGFDPQRCDSVHSSSPCLFRTGSDDTADNDWSISLVNLVLLQHVACRSLNHHTMTHCQHAAIE